jgi:hypothetical protein
MQVPDPSTPKAFLGSFEMLYLLVYFSMLWSRSTNGLITKFSNQKVVNLNSSPLLLRLDLSLAAKLWSVRYSIFYIRNSLKIISKVYIRQWTERIMLLEVSIISLISVGIRKSSNAERLQNHKPPALRLHPLNPKQTRPLIHLGHNLIFFASTFQYNE